MKQRKFVWFVLFVAGLSLVFTSQREKPGFSLKNIRSSFMVESRWAQEPLTSTERAKLEEIFAQEFNYLGSGAEMYAFESADGNYVIKFFKMKHLVPKNWLKYIPFLESYKSKKIDRRIARHNELFSSYKLAYDHLRAETGLVYIHLNKSKDLKWKVTLLDRMRKKYVLPLDRYEFVVQKKGQLVYDKLTSLMQRGKKEEAIEAVYSLLTLIKKQCRMGYVDRDSGISQNYGFLGENVIHFDVGRIEKARDAKEPAFYQREILRVGKKLHSWAEQQWPSLAHDIEELINGEIDLSS